MPKPVPAFKLNPQAVKAWRDGIRQMAGVTGKTDPEGLQQLVIQSAKRFIKNIVDVTPPAKGKADASAKKAGELTIINDLLKLALPTEVVGGGGRNAKGRFTAAADYLASEAQLLAAYQSARVGAAGRVNPRSRKEKLHVSQADFTRLVAKQQAKVGFLAAALNAAANKLGQKLPAWIARHGNKFGTILFEVKDVSIKIHIGQNTPYTDNVSGYARQWEFAYQKEIKSLLAQAQVLGKKRARKAGFNLR